MIEVVPASPAHIGTLAARMRPIDRLECAVFGHSPKAALRASMRDACMAFTAKLDGRPEAMFGVATVSMLEGIGSPWLLLTDDGARQGKALVRMGRNVTRLFEREFRVLRNNVHADNETAIRWLGHLGYTVGPPFDMHGHSMRPFQLNRDAHYE